MTLASLQKNIKERLIPKTAVLFDKNKKEQFLFILGTGLFSAASWYATSRLEGGAEFLAFMAGLLSAGLTGIGAGLMLAEIRSIQLIYKKDFTSFKDFLKERGDTYVPENFKLTPEENTALFNLTLNLSQVDYLKKQILKQKFLTHDDILKIQEIMSEEEKEQVKKDVIMEFLKDNNLEQKSKVFVEEVEIELGDTAIAKNALIMAIGQILTIKNPAFKLGLILFTNHFYFLNL